VAADVFDDAMVGDRSMEGAEQNEEHAIIRKVRDDAINVRH
jgi:hypothetical protein